MRPREFYLVIPIDFNTKYPEDISAFIEPSEKDFKYWKEHEHIWEVIKVVEIEE